MADDPQHYLADQNNHGPDFDPTKELNEDRDPFDVEERISELGSVYSADHTVSDDQSKLSANPVTVD